MDFIIDNWLVIVVAIVLVVSAVIAIVRFFRTPTKAQLNKVREWLLIATARAEKELGSGTGKLKLRFVYDLFVGRFPWLAKVISFERFSDLVDEALEDLNGLLKTNSAVNTYVNGSAEQ